MGIGRQKSAFHAVRALILLDYERYKECMRVQCL